MNSSKSQINTTNGEYKINNITKTKNCIKNSRTEKLISDYSASFPTEEIFFSSQMVKKMSTKYFESGHTYMKDAKCAEIIEK